MQNQRRLFTVLWEGRHLIRPYFLYRLQPKHSLTPDLKAEANARIQLCSIKLDIKGIYKNGKQFHSSHEIFLKELFFNKENIVYINM